MRFGSRSNQSDRPVRYNFLNHSCELSFEFKCECPHFYPDSVKIWLNKIYYLILSCISHHLTINNPLNTPYIILLKISIIKLSLFPLSLFSLLLIYNTFTFLCDNVKNMWFKQPNNVTDKITDWLLSCHPPKVTASVCRWWISYSVYVSE